jgi:hypothetical protein
MPNTLQEKYNFNDIIKHLSIQEMWTVFLSLYVWKELHASLNLGDMLTCLIELKQASYKGNMHFN